jgi:hypothetical protein
MKKLLVFLAIVAFVGTAFTAIAADNGPASIKLDKAKMGVVTFDHAAHQGLAKTECKTCHHTGGYEKCDSCHGAKADGAKLKYKDAIHKNCKGCHKEKKKGPTKCKECHVK